MKIEKQIFISYCALLGAVIAIVISCIRVSPIATDWATLLVTILSTLVCVLLGWQIYTLIDLRRIKQEIEKIRVKSLLDNERNQTITTGAIADYYYSIVVGETPNSNEYYLIYYRVSQLFHASNINDIGMCESVIKVLNEVISRPKNIKVSPTNKKHILELYLQVNHKEEHWGIWNC